MRGPHKWRLKSGMRIHYIRHGKYILTAVIAVVAVMAIYTLGSLSRQYGEAVNAVAPKLPIYCTDDDTMRVGLTINCAWGAEDIPEILDILDRAEIQATFFVLGVWAEKNPEMLKQIYERGHEIGNHSYSHKLPSKSTAKQLGEEIDKCNDAVESILGIRPNLYRAPSGDHTDTLLDLVESKGMYAIKWSVDSIDWRDDMTASDIISRVTGRTTSGSILLFHNDTKHTVSVLPEIISHLQGEGYRFVKISELIYKDHYRIDNQGMQCGQ